MSKFHVNPETGSARKCSAKIKCRFGEDEAHYDSKELAMAAFEESQSTSSALEGIKNSPSKVDRTPNSNSFAEEKASSSRIMKDFMNPIKIGNDSAPHTLRYENGRAITFLDAPEATGLSGDYYIGDLTQDSKTIVDLIQADPRLELINGDCLELAEDLYINYPDHVESISEIIPKGSRNSVHVIAKLKDGSYIDGLGHWSEEGLVNSWGNLLGEDFAIKDYDDIPDQNPDEAIYDSTKILAKYLESLKKI